MRSKKSYEDVTRLDDRWHKAQISDEEWQAKKLPDMEELEKQAQKLEADARKLETRARFAISKGSFPFRRELTLA